MQICRSLAGYSYGHADLVRKAMAKKKPEVMLREREAFVHGSRRADGSVECIGAVGNGIDEKTANEIFDEMVSFASYAFGKSHAAAYATLSYQTAFLKYHYPKEYFAALLTSIQDYMDKMVEYIHAIRKLGLRILPPDVNESTEGFTAVPQGIRFGLLGIKNIGRGLIAAILAEREKGPFSGFMDFCERIYSRELNRRALESLIKSGALDSLGYNRHEMLEGYETLLSDMETVRRHNLAGQMNLFEGPQASSAGRYTLPRRSEFPLQTLLELEKEVTGVYISGHPLDAYVQMAEEAGAVEIRSLLAASEEEPAGEGAGRMVMVLCIIASRKLKATKNGQMMAFAVAEDQTGWIEMLVFPKVLERVGALLSEGKVVAARGRLSVREDEDPKLLLEELYDPQSLPARQVAPKPQQEASGKKRKGLYLKVSSRLDSRFEEACALLRQHRGDCPVYIYFNDEQKLTQAPQSLFIRYSPAVHARVAAILGEKNVKWVS